MVARLLNGCTLALCTPPPALAAFAGRLDYQARRLGLRRVDEGVRLAGGLGFTLHTPFTAPVCCGWLSQGGGHGHAAGEALLQAASGLMSVHGRAGGAPRLLGVDYVSTLASVLALNGALACAVGQWRGGRFSRCDGSLLGAALLAVGQYLADATAPDQDGLAPAVPGEAAAHPPFVSADGMRFELEALEAGPWLQFWRSAGVAADVAGQGWQTFQWRYARAMARQPAPLPAAATALPFARLCELARAAGIALSPLRTLAMRAGDADEIELRRRGPWAFAFPPAAPLPPDPGRAPAALPLEGLVVLESCRRIQGPLAGHLLAMLGARVIRIEPPGGDALRGMPPLAGGCSARFDALNRLKTVIEIDLKSEAGRRELKARVAGADVFLHNWAPGKAAAFGLDRDDLLALKPTLVYARAAGWDDDADPGLPGTDFMAQAHTGVADAIASASGTRGGTLFAALDVLGGAVAAQGITAALFARRARHSGALVRTSLAGAASLLCASPADPGCSGAFPTADGMLALDCRDEGALARLADLLGGTPADGLAVLACRLREKGTSDWLPLLAGAGIPAARVVEDLARLPRHPHAGPLLGDGGYAQVNSPWHFPA